MSSFVPTTRIIRISNANALKKVRLWLKRARARTAPGALALNSGYRLEMHPQMQRMWKPVFAVKDYLIVSDPL